MFVEQDVCRCLGLDLTGQTSASYNMRLNYEKCLLEFEEYVKTGKFAEDQASGKAPSATHITLLPTATTGTPVPLRAGPEALAAAPATGSGPSGASYGMSFRRSR